MHVNASAPWFHADPIRARDMIVEIAVADVEVEQPITVEIDGQHVLRRTGAGQPQRLAQHHGPAGGADVLHHHCQLGPRDHDIAIAVVVEIDRGDRGDHHRRVEPARRDELEVQVAAIAKQREPSGTTAGDELGQPVAIEIHDREPTAAIVRGRVREATDARIFDDLEPTEALSAYRVAARGRDRIDRVGRATARGDDRPPDNQSHGSS